MKLLEVYLNKEVDSVLRLDPEYEQEGIFYSLGLFIKFQDEELGIALLTDGVGAQITAHLQTEEEFVDNKLNGYGVIHTPKSDDTLNPIIGKKVNNIKSCYYEVEEVPGNDFTMLRGSMQAILFQFDGLELIVKNSGDEIWMDVDNKIDIDLKEFAGAVWS